MPVVTIPDCPCCSPVDVDSGAYSSGSAATGVGVPCCGRLLPEILYLTLSGGGGTFELIYNPSNQTWESGVVTVSGCGRVQFAWSCEFTVPGFQARIDCSFITDAETVFFDCGPPLVYTANITFTGMTCGCNGTTKTITITE